MNDINQDALRIVVKDLRAYFKSNPNAADTLEGIAKWWHERARYEDARRTIKAALEYLEKEGEVSSRGTAQGDVIYSAARKGTEG